MINKNDEIIVTIDGYNSEGQGIARVDGFVVFVPFSIVGEKIKVHIIKVTKNYAVGKIVQIIEGSKDRANPPCPYFSKCGGCALQHMNYQTSLKAKAEIVKNALVKMKINVNVKIANVMKKKNKSFRFIFFMIK